MQDIMHLLSAGSWVTSRKAPWVTSCTRWRACEADMHRKTASARVRGWVQGQRQRQCHAHDIGLDLVRGIAWRQRAREVWVVEETTGVG